MCDVTKDVYFCKDLMESSALLCTGAKLLRLEATSTFCWFVFADKKRCEELSNHYWSGDLQTSAKAYADSIRSLKDRLFSRR